jgi:hypothetical protein
MLDRLFEVSDPRPGDDASLRMSEDEVRQTYGFLVDVLDLEGFQQVIVVTDDTRLTVTVAADTRNQHALSR